MSPETTPTPHADLVLISEVTDAELASASARIVRRSWETVSRWSCAAQASGLTRKDLEEVLGSRTRVAEALNRRRGLSINMIRRLHETLGISADIDPTESRKSNPTRKTLMRLRTVLGLELHLEAARVAARCRGAMTSTSTASLSTSTESLALYPRRRILAARERGSHTRGRRAPRLALSVKSGMSIPRQDVLLRHLSR